MLKPPKKYNAQKCQDHVNHQYNKKKEWQNVKIYVDYTDIFKVSHASEAGYYYEN